MSITQTGSIPSIPLILFQISSKGVDGQVPSNKFLISLRTSGTLDTSSTLISSGGSTISLTDVSFTGG